MTLLAFPSLQTVFDINGKPVRAAQVSFFAAGTNSPIQVHKVSTLDSAYTQPISASGLGRFPPIFTNAAEYRVRITDQYGGLIEDIDGISGTDAGSGGGGGDVGGVVDANSLLMTGDILFNLSSGTRAGFVRLNGRTISKAGGSGTERANDDLHALFVYLWNAIAGLVVVGGRGANAEADWSAVKQLTLPDLRGRGPLGADAMGSTAANRFSGGLISSGTSDGIGSVGGEAATTAPLPAHAHTVSEFGSGFENQAFTHNFSATTSLHAGHSHDVSGAYTAIAAGSGYGAASAAALIKSSIGTTADGQHTHTVSGTTAAQNQNHNHQIPAHATTSAGAGGTHNTLSPFIIGTWFIRL